MQWYRIIDASSIVLAAHPESVLDQWVSYLTNVNRLLVLIQNQPKVLHIHDYVFEFTEKQIYFLSQIKPPFRHVSDVPTRPGIKKVHAKHLELSDGSYATCLVAYELTDTGLLKLLQDSRPHEVIVAYWDATTQLRTLHSIVRTYRRQLRRGVITSSGELLLQDLERMLDNISRGSKLLKFLVIVVLHAFSLEELQDLVKQFVAKYATYGLALEQTSLIQDLLYTLPEQFQEQRTSKLLPELYSDSRSLRWTYPVASQDLIEPGGVLLGKNLATGGPVIINLYEPYNGRTNWHVLITGISDAGKTFTASVLVKRMVETYDPWTFIIDPMSNWCKFARELG